MTRDQLQTILAVVIKTEHSCDVELTKEEYLTIAALSEELNILPFITNHFKNKGEAK